MWSSSGEVYLDANSSYLSRFLDGEIYDIYNMLSKEGGKEGEHALLMLLLCSCCNYDIFAGPKKSENKKLITNRWLSKIVTSAQKFLIEREIVLPLKPSEGFPIN